MCICIVLNFKLHCTKCFIKQHRQVFPTKERRKKKKKKKKKDRPKPTGNPDPPKRPLSCRLELLLRFFLSPLRLGLGLGPAPLPLTPKISKLKLRWTRPCTSLSDPDPMYRLQNNVISLFTVILPWNGKGFASGWNGVRFGRNRAWGRYHTTVKISGSVTNTLYCTTSEQKWWAIDHAFVVCTSDQRLTSSACVHGKQGAAILPV